MQNTIILGGLKPTAHITDEHRERWQLNSVSQPLQRLRSQQGISHIGHALLLRAISSLRQPASHALCVQRKRPFVRNQATLRMTLKPQESSWKEDRDRIAIENEFKGCVHTSVDADMSVLRERMSLISRKEKQWKEVCEQFSALSFLTGIPMLSDDNGEPTFTAWLFVFLSLALPLYLVYELSDWLYRASESFAAVPW